MDKNKEKVNQLMISLHSLRNKRRDSSDDGEALNFLSHKITEIIQEWEPPNKVDSVCACGKNKAPTFIDGVEVCMTCTKNIEQD